ncbi:MAG: short-chain dehydrogenase [Paenibacillaceae bacterium]|jgi:NAD(P)-dependent dehydrogenase (short-subunit alcohol dehydrogenase family)|nr:short-chain dehydrogenase [Paenibacillaceae bacterium]
MSSIEGKVAVISGATGGMGTILARELAARGVNLALTSNDQSGLERLQAAASGAGVRSLAFPADITKEAEVERVFQLVRERYGKADMLINLAGVSIPAKVEAMEEEAYDVTLDVNLKGTFLCCKHFIPLVQPEDGGRIINIGSMAAKRANGNAPMYCAAKAAVHMFSQGLGIQTKDQNIRVTTLNPGPADTGFWGDRQVPREKFLQASDVVDVILFVLTADARLQFHEIAFESFYSM